MGSPTHSSDSHSRHATLNPNLLLVEDDEDTRELMALALGAAGFAVRTAGSGREALTLLAEGTYDLVVTDYDMPGMTGTEMLKIGSERNILKGARPLIVTAHPSPKGTEGFPLFRKPLDLTRFVAMLRSFHTLGVEAGPQTGGTVDHGPAPRRSDAWRPGDTDSH